MFSYKQGWPLYEAGGQLPYIICKIKQVKEEMGKKRTKRRRERGRKREKEKRKKKWVEA